MFDYKCRSAIQLLPLCPARFEWVIQPLCRSIEGANRKTRFLSVQAPFHGYALFRSPPLTKSYSWHHPWGGCEGYLCYKLNVTRSRIKLECARISAEIALFFYWRTLRIFVWPPGRNHRVGKISHPLSGFSPISMTTICNGEEFDTRALGGWLGCIVRGLGSLIGSREAP